MALTLGSWTITEPFSACEGWNGSMTVFNRDANNVQVAYMDPITGKRIVRVSTDGATSWGTEKLNWLTEYTYNQSIWSDNSYIYTVATKYIPLSTSRLTLSVSTDNGSTFTDKTIFEDSHTSNIPPTMEVYSGTIYVLFLTEGLGYYGAKLKLAISSDQGDSWTIKDVGPFYPNALQTNMGIDLKVINSNTIYACTYRQYDYINHVFYKSTDAGDNWSLVQLPYTAGDDYSYVSLDVKDADNIYVLIHNTYSATKGLYLAKSIDAGATWNKARLTTQFVSQDYSLQYYNNIIFLAYIDYPATELFLMYSENYGTDWATIIVDNTEPLGNFASLSVNASTIYIFYTDTWLSGGNGEHGKIAKCSIASLPISSIYHKWHEPVVIQ